MVGGSPDNMCWWKAHWMHSEITKGCIDRKHRNSNIGCTERIVDRQTYSYCINGQYHPTNQVSNFLINISSESPSHNSTPYIRVYFEGANYNSWIDILVKKTQQKVISLSSFDKKYPPESFPGSEHSKSKLKRIVHDINYLLLLHLYTSNGIQVKTNLNVFAVTHFSPPAIPLIGKYSITYKLITMEWNATVSLSPKFPSYLISVAGKPNRFFVTLGNNTNINYILKSYWILDNYKRKPHKYFSCNVKLAINKNKNLIYCQEIRLCNVVNGTKCLSWSQYVFLGTKLSKNVINNKVGATMTWNFASRFCKSVGGFLPTIRSQHELNDLSSVIKIVGHGVQIDYIPIGLILNNLPEHKVMYNVKK